jgi:hypothetical protein
MSKVYQIKLDSVIDLELKNLLKKYDSYYQHSIDLDTSKKYFNKVLEESDKDNIKSFSSSGILHYAKPFDKNSKARIKNNLNIEIFEELLNCEEMVLHNNIIDLRDKFIAHHDKTNLHCSSLLVIFAEGIQNKVIQIEVASFIINNNSASWYENSIVIINKLLNYIQGFLNTLELEIVAYINSDFELLDDFFSKSLSVNNEKKFASLFTDIINEKVKLDKRFIDI